MKRGFTLIELSIVLIIIGLLVGGVLAGRDLIQQAELNGVLNDINRFKTAVYTFRLKYDDALPGDMDNAASYWPTDCTDGGSNTCNGDGDLTISSQTERIRYWHHLQLAGLIADSLSGCNGSTSGVFNDCRPAVPGDRDRYYINQGDYSDYVNSSDETIRTETGVFMTSNDYMFLETEVRSMDVKSDDGVATSGHMGMYAQSSEDSTCLNATLTDYDLTNSGSGDDCTIVLNDSMY